MFVTIILISLITLSLLVFLVLGLHLYQQSIAQTNADNHNSLPPLDDVRLNGNLPDLSLDVEEDSTTVGAVDPEAGTISKPDLETGPGEDDEQTEIIEPKPVAPKSDTWIESPGNGDDNAGESLSKTTAYANAPNEEAAGYQEVESFPSSSDSDSIDSAENSDNWQELVAELKKQDRFDEALDVCQQEYPLWSAYQQASLIHRAKIKRLIQDGGDVSEELRALYRVATEASFLHDRVKGLPNLSLAQLKLLDLSPIAELDMPYLEIGYTELRLIKKTDIKLLLEKWGKPTSHRRPREIHSEAWESLCGATQSTLF